MTRTKFEKKVNYVKFSAKKNLKKKIKNVVDYGAKTNGI